MRLDVRRKIGYTENTKAPPKAQTPDGLPLILNGSNRTTYRVGRLLLFMPKFFKELSRFVKHFVKRQQNQKNPVEKGNIDKVCRKM